MLTCSILTITTPDGTNVARECSTTLEMVLRNHDLFAYLYDGGTDADLSPHVQLEWVQWLLLVECTSVECSLPFDCLDVAA